MEVVAITGGCGMMGRHVIRRLCENEQVQEVRVLDRSRQRQESHSKLRYESIELTNESDLERCLRRVTTVVHLAKANIPLSYQSKEELSGMWRDNLEVTEVLMDTLISLSIPRLVFIGDAYSFLSKDDNYGLSEETHSELPSTYLLGEYGESRAKSEMAARRMVKKEPSLSGIFLRPTWIHSPLPSSFWTDLVNMTKMGNIPYIVSDRRALHQFIYADNLASIIENSIFSLKKDPSTFSNEVVYCMDDTVVINFTETLSSLTLSPTFAPSNSSSFFPTLFSHAYNHILYLCGASTVNKDQLPLHTFRTIFEKTIGFTDKKLRLLLRYQPEVSPSESFTRSRTGFLHGESMEKRETQTITEQPTPREDIFVLSAEKQAIIQSGPRSARMG